MSDTVYEKLRAFLDAFPLGFPRTDSGIEIKILKKLFTDKEAFLATLLTPFPEDADQVAQRTGTRETDLEENLVAMSKKGLIFRTRREGRTLFNAVPFMIGLYEYSVLKMDSELAKMYQEYYEQAYQAEMGASNIPGFKVIPISENIHADMTCFPYGMLEDEIRSARKISIAPCICRKEARLTGKGCDGPIETCFSFGAAAEYYIENGIGREIGVEEALDILKKTDDAGLVHAGVNTKHLSNLCNCCPCCCASMKGISQKGHARHKYLNALFVAAIDDEQCTLCGICADRCPVGSITIGNKARVNEKLCLGCGLCAGSCPSDAIAVNLRKDRDEPFNRVLELGMAILQGKQMNVSKDRKM
jgi:electron transport complex protein RnfB